MPLYKEPLDILNQSSDKFWVTWSANCVQQTFLGAWFLRQYNTISIIITLSWLSAYHATPRHNKSFKLVSHWVISFRGLGRDQNEGLYWLFLDAYFIYCKSFHKIGHPCHTLRIKSGQNIKMFIRASDADKKQKFPDTDEAVNVNASHQSPIFVYMLLRAISGDVMKCEIDKNFP